MAKLKIECDGRTYTLEYTRETARTMERQGFSLDEMAHRPVTMMPMLFRGAFLANHGGIKESRVTEIYDRLGNRAALNQRLSEMYADTVLSLMGDVEDTEELADEKKAVWEEV